MKIELQIVDVVISNSIITKDDNNIYFIFIWNGIEIQRVPGIVNKNKVEWIRANDKQSLGPTIAFFISNKFKLKECLLEIIVINSNSSSPIGSVMLLGESLSQLLSDCNCSVKVDKSMTIKFSGKILEFNKNSNINNSDLSNNSAKFVIATDLEEDTINWRYYFQNKEEEEEKKGIKIIM